METLAHSTEDHGGVNDNLVTRFLGICIGLGVVAALVSTHYMWGWSWAAVSCTSGTLGAILGALGSSVQGPNNASILAYTGVVTFLGGFLMFTGILQMFLR